MRVNKKMINWLFKKNKKNYIIIKQINKNNNIINKKKIIKKNKILIKKKFKLKKKIKQKIIKYKINKNK